MRYLFYPLLLLFPLVTNAQIKKGQVIWTGQLSSEFMKNQQEGVKTPAYNQSVSGEASFFIKEGIAWGLGAQGNWNGNKSIAEGPNGFTLKYIGKGGSLTPFIRKYWQFSPLFIYAGGGVVGTFSKFSMQREDFGQVNELQFRKEFQLTSQFQLGVIFPVTSRLGLQFGARSQLFPFSFNVAELGLVVLSGADTHTAKDAPAISPLARGRWVLSGSFSTSGDKGFSGDGGQRIDYDNPATSIALAPGLFVRDRLLMGLGVQVGIHGGANNISGSAGYFTVNDRTPVSIGLRPFVKKYLSSAKLSPYLEGYASYHRIMAGGPATNTYNAGANFGLAYSLGKSWLAEARLLGVSGGYSRVGSMDAEIATIPAIQRFHFNLESGFQPGFVVSYIFR
ncbi:hypothetical protein DYBT9275_02593 [Dyadobacter sp. CECT 9275]|uniref:Outer membrane protein beta-barrel domain-containing protein n=1 Tax=Dyadobacter helix TaxID=2822344 RepID=A0A916JCX4_9BACT|nr:hypothetical protein [Dyadobacter sp. CECT 9275]CAG5001093.1 hypothetical protein DYBT9275_02593 [Dyadobacter sp. CECT 9275]